MQQSISGLVFDSAPSYMSTSSLHRATTLVMQTRFPAWAHPLVSLVIWVLVIGVVLVSLVRDGFSPPRPQQYWYAPEFPLPFCTSFYPTRSTEHEPQTLRVTAGSCRSCVACAMS